MTNGLRTGEEQGGNGQDLVVLSPVRDSPTQEILVPFTLVPTEWNFGGGPSSGGCRRASQGLRVHFGDVCVSEEAGEGVPPARPPVSETEL